MADGIPIADAISAVHEVIEDGKPWYRLRLTRGLRAAITYLEEHERVVAERDAAIAASESLALQIRDLAGFEVECAKERDAARAELAEAEKRLQYQEGHREPCYYCGEPCNSLLGNPGLWPLAFCHADDPGVVKFHHTHCVTRRLAEDKK